MCEQREDSRDHWDSVGIAASFPVEVGLCVIFAAGLGTPAGVRCERAKMPRMLTDHQSAFIDLLVQREALRFGEFTLKSGRSSPYFINTGCFHRASDLLSLGAAYADAIRRLIDSDVDIVFGPAYKGIPLALGTAQAYAQQTGRDVGWCYDRKEVKDHGDRGSFVGAPLENGARVVVVDDVLTAGTALRESLTKLQPQNVTVVGAIVSVDRMEAGPGGTGTAIEELRAESGVPVHAIIDIAAVADHLHGERDADGRPRLSDDDYQRIRAHLDRQ